MRYPLPALLFVLAGTGPALTCEAPSSFDRIVGATAMTRAYETPATERVAFTLDPLHAYRVLCEGTAFHRITSTDRDGGAGYIRTRDAIPWPTREMLVLENDAFFAGYRIIAWSDRDRLDDFLRTGDLARHANDIDLPLDEDLVETWPFPVLGKATGSLRGEREKTIYRVLLPLPEADGFRVREAYLIENDRLYTSEFQVSRAWLDGVIRMLRALSVNRIASGDWRARMAVAAAALSDGPLDPAASLDVILREGAGPTYRTALLDFSLEDLDAFDPADRHRFQTYVARRFAEAGRALASYRITLGADGEADEVVSVPFVLLP